MGVVRKVEVVKKAVDEGKTLRIYLSQLSSRCYIMPEKIKFSENVFLALREEDYIKYMGKDEHGIYSMWQKKD